MPQISELTSATEVNDSDLFLIQQTDGAKNLTWSQLISAAEEVLPSEFENADLLATYTNSNDDITTAVTNTHTHGNKDLLDTYTNSDDDISTAIGNSHTHDNFDVLDGLSDTDGELYYGDSAVVNSDNVSTAWAATASSDDYSTFSALCSAVIRAFCDTTINSAYSSVFGYGLTGNSVGYGYVSLALLQAWNTNSDNILSDWYGITLDGWDNAVGSSTTINGSTTTGTCYAPKFTVDIIGDWVSGKSYKVGYFALYDGILYKCITANSDEEFTVDNWDTVSGGGASGLDFAALTTALTTGTLSGITIAANEEETAFDFTVTGIPEIAIDSEGYWTIDGDRGENPTKAQGENGADGYSPTANVTQTDTGATVTITDASGTTTAELTNGTDGVSPIAAVEQTDTGATITITDSSGTTTANITNGTDGTDGYSPTATVEQTDTGATVTITDTNGTTTAEIQNGVTTVSTEKVDLTAVFTADGWSDSVPYSQTVAVDEITAELNPRIDVVISEDVDTGLAEEEAFSCITRAVTTDGAITAYCYEEVPTVDFTIMIEVV